MVLNFIKPDKTADFEAVIAKLKEALQKSEKPERKQQAASWKVFKSPDPAAGGNVLYVFVIDPAVKGADYTVSTILAEAFPHRGPGALQAVRRGLRVRPELRQSVARVRPREVARRNGCASELQIQSCIEAVRWRVQRAASQLEDPVVHPQPDRSSQRDLTPPPVLKPTPCPESVRAPPDTSRRRS